jgi:MFS family permease
MEGHRTTTIWMFVTATARPHRPSSPCSESASHSVFSSLRTRNFRLFTTGQLFSNTGTWVQRIAQDWLVLSLTGSATAVGVTTALQFLPTLLFGLFGGMIADRYPKRAILLVTQSALGLIAGVLAVLTLTHMVAAWQVYVVAFALGLVTAVDNPTRQSFANEMVGPAQLSNAISINSSVFQLGGLIGPAISGVLISAVGPGYSFAINAASFAAPLAALAMMRPAELRRVEWDPDGGGQLRDELRSALHWAVGEPHVLWPTVLAGVFGLFTANLAVTLAAYAHSVFHSGPSGYGLLSATVAAGSVAGALVCARLPRPRLRVLLAYGLVLAMLEIVSAAVPGQVAFAVLLVPIGACTLLLLTSTNSVVQTAAHDTMRGRIMGIYLLVFIGGAALGGPLLGFVDEHAGPRSGMLLAGVVPALAVVLIAAKLARDRARRVRRASSERHLSLV